MNASEAAPEPEDDDESNKRSPLMTEVVAKSYGERPAVVRRFPVGNRGRSSLRRPGLPRDMVWVERADSTWEDAGVESGSTPASLAS